MKNLISRLIASVLALGCLSATAVTAFASEPYDSYSYDNWGDAIPSQAAYRVEKVCTGKDMGLKRLSDASDKLYIGANEPMMLSEASDIYFESVNKEFWIADTGNNRIIRLNENLQLMGCYKLTKQSDGNETAINSPKGVFVEVKDSQIYMYIADSGNSRIVKAKVTSETDCEELLVITMPESELYTSKTFIPEKILVDNGGSIYAVCSSVNTGAAQFDMNGNFKGFYGANRVEATAEVIRQRIWRMFASNKQLEGMTRSVPVEYKNFDIDADGFIFTCTEAANTSTDAVKKLNPAGYNIWNNDAGNNYHFGDIVNGVVFDATTGTNHTTRLTDIEISQDGMINVLDYETGRVFQYDEFCNLVCIFGTRNVTSDQRGGFKAPNAIESNGQNIYIIDGTKNDVTIYTTTVFGQYVHKAVLLYDEGLYLEAKPYWEEVVKRDGTFTFAYVGLGKACLNSGDYKQAMEHFKTAYDRYDYNRAFKYYRDEWLRNNFNTVVIVIVVLVVLIYVLKILKKKGIIKPITIKKKDKKKKAVTLTKRQREDLEKQSIEDTRNSQEKEGE